VGLGKLKEQQEHFGNVVSKIPKPNATDIMQSRMEYGTRHEIDAIATLTVKVLPFFYPDHNYFKEGCVPIPYSDQPFCMVVSPDGSFRKSEHGPTVMMYENKCKAPNAYSPTAYYTILHYYVTQLLSEMHVYNCPELLFTCWSEQSMTVFHVDFNQYLWDAC
jgi:hypothetical protein